MPNIRQYENPIDGLKGDDRGGQAAVFAARHVEAEWAQAGRVVGSGIADLGGTYVKQRALHQISQGLSTAAEIQDNLTTAWNVTAKNADPNDPSTAEKFREEQLNPILDAWTSGFDTDEGKAWATQHAAQLRQHFFEKTAADQSTMAGQAAVDNYTHFVTGMSNTVLQDPSSLNMALGTADTALAAYVGSNPNITADQASAMHTELRDKARKEITKSAFIGMARSNPDAAMQALQDGFGKNDLDGTDRNGLFGFAESIKREKRADERAETAMQKEQQKEDFNAQASTLTASIFNSDGSTSIPPGYHQKLLALASHPGADAGRIEAMGNAAKAAAEAKINGTFQTTDNSTWQNLAGRIGAPDGSPNALTHTMVDQAYASGRLSEHDWRFLHQAVETAKADPAANKALQQLNQSLERVKPLVDHSNLYSGKLDQSGVQLYDDLHFDTYAKYQQLVGQGKTPAEAVNILTDPRNPQGIQANLSPYQTNNKAGLAAIHARVSANGGPTSVAAPNLTTARKPGESAAAYLARTQK